MRYLSVSGLALAMACAQLPAQTLYRCGNEYRDTPCPNGVAVDARDPRTPAQKSEAQSLSAKEGALADQMETSRLQSEAVAAKRLQAQAQREAAQEKKRAAEAQAAQRVQHAQDAVVLKPHKKQREDVFTVRSAKPPKNTASAAKTPKSP
jgi:hypothetical protein